MEWLAERGVEVSAPILYVSAYRDIGRGDWPCKHPRTNAKYFESFVRLAERLHAPLLLYCDPAVRPSLPALPSWVYVLDLADAVHADGESLFSDKYAAIETKIASSAAFQELLGSDGPRKKETSHALYNLVNHDKVLYIRDAARRCAGCPAFTHVTWLDFGLHKHGSASDADVPSQQIDIAKLPSDRVLYQAVKKPPELPMSLLEMLHCRDVFIAGSIWVISIHLAEHYATVYEQELQRWHAEGIVDDDQGLVYQLHLRHPSLFDLFVHKKWFSIFGKYLNVCSTGGNHAQVQAASATANTSADGAAANNSADGTTADGAAANNSADGAAAEGEDGGAQVKLSTAAYCKYCTCTFSSRNQLFKHLSTCKANPHAQETAAAVPVEVERVVLHLASYSAQVDAAAELDAALWRAIDAARGIPPPAADARCQLQRYAEVPPASFTRSGLGTRAVYETISFVTEKIESRSNKDYVDAVNSSLPANVELLARIPVPQTFHSIQTCEWWRFECLVPVSVLWGQQEDMTGSFGFDNLNFRPLSKKNLKQTSVRTTQSPPEQQKRLFGDLKTTLKTFCGKHNFQHLLQDHAAADGRYLRVLSCFCRGILSSEAVGKAETMNGQCHQFACISICTECLPPAHLCEAIIGLAIAVCRGVLPREAIEDLYEWDAAAITLPIPTVPQDSIMLVECAYDKFEAACLDKLQGQQLRVRHRQDNSGHCEQRHKVQAVRDRLQSLLCESESLHRWAESELSSSRIEQLRAAFEEQRLGSMAAISAQSLLSEPPPVYAKALELLRDANKSGKWPCTAKLMGSGILNAQGDQFLMGQFSGAQFGFCKKQPTANTVLPDLLTELQSLEHNLRAAQPGSNYHAACSSSVILVSRHSQFAPHSDKKLLQLKSNLNLQLYPYPEYRPSMLVCFGSFTGGCVFVHDDSGGNQIGYDAHYSPVYFDGRVQHYSSECFNGEIFCVVWHQHNYWDGLSAPSPVTIPPQIPLLPSVAPKVAILVPYRDQPSQNRSQQLQRFLQYMPPFLLTTGESESLHDATEIVILIVEQDQYHQKFNRGLLLNIGTHLAAEMGCTQFIFHDVDMLPSPELLPWYLSAPCARHQAVTHVAFRCSNQSGYNCLHALHLFVLRLRCICLWHLFVLRLSCICLWFDHCIYL